MKKTFFVTLLLIFTIVLVAEDIMQPTNLGKELNNVQKRKGKLYTGFRDAPDFEFIVDPYSLISTFYDYMPGSYNSIPVRVQPEISEPYGLPAGGTYMTYHIRETAGATRRLYFSYVNESGVVSATDPISTSDEWEGYSGVDIDPVTADPMVAWHTDFGSPDGIVYMAYDLYHMMGSPGLWIDPFEVINNSYLAGQGIYPYPDDLFFWPYTFIGTSPLGGDYRRVYVYANNYTNSHGPNSAPSENVLIGYADFNTSDLDAQSSLSWSYRTIAQLDAWNAEDPEWIRPFKGMAVYDNVVVFAGYNTNNEVFVLYNDNYGEGDFEYYCSDFIFDQWNPLNETGTAYLYSDDATPLTSWIVSQEILHAGHMNVIFKDNNTKIAWTGALGITFDALDGNGPGYYFPEWCQIYPKDFVFDLNTLEFSFKDLYIEGANPNDNIPMVPWDLDEDGVVDSFDEDGDPEWVWNWPIYWPVGGDAFHENVFRIVKNENWLAAVWSDGTKAKRFYDGDDTFAAWEATPEIAIVISADNGDTWSEPIFLNANDTPELDSQIPTYPYPGDLIEIISNVPGDYRGKLHLFYLDDNDFGSTVQGNGQNNGGTLQYAALNIEFPGEWNPQQSNDNNEVPISGFLAQNYPNPFNPETTILFTTENTEKNTELVIFNLKGQKVRTLVNERLPAGQHSIIWDGTNDNHKKVSSGVYFYRMTAGDYTSTKKMILLK